MNDSSKKITSIYNNMLDNLLAPRDNRGRRNGEISARRVFNLMDCGFSFMEIRHAVESENLVMVEEMIRFAKVKEKNKNPTRVGRPVSDGVRAIIESCGMTLDNLYSFDEGKRKRILARARQAAAEIKK
jgi:hypothetical protein